MVIGLLCSGDGIPIAHHVFAGNTSDVSTLPGVLDDLVDRFAVGQICVVADRGLISETNIDQVEAACCDWLFATKLHGRAAVAAVLAAAGHADDDAWVEVEQFSSRVCDLDHDGRRYLVVFSNARATPRHDPPGAADRQDRTKLLALEERVRAASSSRRPRSPRRRHHRGPFPGPSAVRHLGLAAAGSSTTTTTTRWPTTRPWPATTSWPPRSTATSPTRRPVLAPYRSLQLVENRFRVLKDFLGLRPMFHWTESRVRGHVAVACSPPSSRR